MMGWIIAGIAAGLSAIMSAFGAEIVKSLGGALASITEASLLTVETIISYTPVQALLMFFEMLGVFLFAIGTIMALIDLGLSYSTGGNVSIVSCFVNIIKGLAASALFVYVTIYCLLF